MKKMSWLEKTGTIGTLVFGLLSAYLGVRTYQLDQRQEQSELEAEEAQAREATLQRRLRGRELLYQALDELGGPGTSTLALQVPIKSQKLELARRKIEQALTLDPDDGQAHRVNGLHLWYTNRRPEAVEEFRTAIRLDPNDAIAYNNIGSAHRTMGALDDASRAFESAIQIDPALPLSYLNLGTVYYGENRMEDAERMFRRVLELEPESALALYNLSSVAHRQGRHADGANLEAQALALNPELADVPQLGERQAEGSALRVRRPRANP